MKRHFAASRPLSVITVCVSAVVVSACTTSTPGDSGPAQRLNAAYAAVAGAWSDGSGDTLDLVVGDKYTASVTTKAFGGPNEGEFQICDADDAIGDLTVAGAAANLMVVFNASGNDGAWCAKYTVDSTALDLRSVDCCAVVAPSSCFAFNTEAAGFQSSVCESQVQTPPDSFFANYSESP